MSRNEANAPSTRMGLVLDDYDALEAAYMELATRFAEADPKAFEQCAPKPPAEAIITERARRQFTLKGVKAARERMRLLRQREGEATTVATRSQPSQQLSPATRAEILAEAGRLAEPIDAPELVKAIEHKE